MKEKKTGAKFTILFNPNDLVHQQAADILNRQPQRGKAHYVAQAIVQYERASGSSDERTLAQIDERFIETVARRVVKEMQMTGAGGLPVPDSQVSERQETIDISNVSADDVIQAMGEDGMKNMADTLAMFRRK